MKKKDLIKIEQSILGTVLNYPDATTKVFEMLKPEHFSEESHQIIYQAILKLFSAGKGIDMLVVSKELHTKGILERAGGSFAIANLTSYSVHYSTIEQYCQIVLQEFLRVEIQKMILTLNQDVNNPTADVFDTIRGIELHLEELTRQTTFNPVESVEKIKDDVIYETMKAIETGKSDGVLTGINRLNIQTNGWQPSDLIILAGRPAMGKTSAAIDFGLTPALSGKSVLFFSLEMSKEQITKRILSILTGIDVQKVVNNTLNKYEIQEIVRQSDVLNGIPLFIDDTPAITLFELKMKAKKMQREKGLDLIIVDYLQLMRSEAKANKNREQEISEISRGLKGLAKELKIPVIALSQLSRRNEDRADKKPMLSDLRESGAIEQDADMVIFCHRPEYYNIEQYEIGGNIIPTTGLFVFIVSKFRNGQTGEIRAGWIGNNTKVTNYQDQVTESIKLPENNDFLNF
jgi:replicative DNA helicase